MYFCMVFILAVVQAKPQISLEYKPTRPFHQPQPSGSHLGVIVPPGKPWPDSESGYQNFGQNFGDIVNRVQDTENSTLKPSGFTWPNDTDELPLEVNSTTTESPKTSTISLEYKPTRPFYHPKPGNNVGQIVRPEQPKPSSSDEQTVSQVVTSPTLVNRIKNTTTSSPKNDEETSINLEYEPNRPFFASKPGSTLNQIIPSGEPYPDSPQGYQNFSQVGNSSNLVNRVKETTLKPSLTTPGKHQQQSSVSLEYKPNRPFFASKPGSTLTQIIPSGEPWPDSPEGYQNFSQVGNSPNLVNRVKETTLKPSLTTLGKDHQQSPISLEYKPNRPFFASKPGSTLTQIIPPGEPWPDSPEGYQNFSQVGNSPNLVNRVKETTLKPSLTTLGKDQQQSPISLEYKPNRPFFASKPGSTLTQIIPPGEPWPDSPEGYQNFSQVANSPNLEIRIKETSSQPSTTVSSKISQPTVSLEYQPSRPPFHPNPGNNVAPIIPSGEPWPHSPEGYQNVSQTSSPNLNNRIQISSTATPEISRSTPDLINLLQELVNKKKPETNGLQSATSELTPAGFTWETKSSAEKIDKNENDEDFDKDVLEVLDEKEKKIELAAKNVDRRSLDEMRPFVVVPFT